MQSKPRIPVLLAVLAMFSTAGVPYAFADGPRSKPEAPTVTLTAPPSRASPGTIHSTPTAPTVKPNPTIPTAPTAKTIGPAAKPAAVPERLNPMLANAQAAGCDTWVKKRLEWAVSHDVPIRMWPFTKYWPGEPSGMGGGWSCANDEPVKVGRIAASTSHYLYWRGHELWVEGYNPPYSGYCRVTDSGPGWKTKNRFDLAAGSVAGVLAWERGDNGDGTRTVRCAIIGCPKPMTCTCDYAVAFRADRKQRGLDK